MKILVTGSGGLIGGEAVDFFSRRGAHVVGIDNNQRREFFGPTGDTEWNTNRLIREHQNFVKYSSDIRNAAETDFLFKYNGPFDAVIHCAAQPSHDWAARDPLIDFGVNAVGTLNVLEAYRKHSPGAHFIFTSTNKVYGDAPNLEDFEELATRYDMVDWDGFDEHTPTDQSTHSVFGASKLGADVMAQEYGRYFGLKTTVFRGGCLTGPNHSGVELHGFLSYLVKCVVHNKPYTIYGYKGKQVRDNIHSQDVLSAFSHVISNPSATPGAVYNLGGGRENSVSVIEAIEIIKGLCGNKNFKFSYEDVARRGDHICYITDNSKFQRDYSSWEITRSLESILNEMVGEERRR